MSVFTKFYLGEQELQSPTTVPRLIVQHLTKDKQNVEHASDEDLANAISEVTLQTQIAGASLLTITFADPQWAIQTSGLLALNTEGILDDISVEFPEFSGSFWRLCMVQGSADNTAPNLTLTFEDEIISELRDKWGPKTVAPGTTTRAQFVKQLVDEVNSDLPEQKLKFVCPSINVLQPIATTKSAGTVITSTTAQQTADKTNKTGGLGHGAAVTVKGVALNANQISEANTLMSMARAKRAGQIATEALVFAAIAESSLGEQPGAFRPNADGFWGVLQGNSKTWHDPHDTAGMADAFLSGGAGFQSGGAIALSRTVSDPIEIAVRVEAPSVWPSNAYATEDGYSNFLPEARAIIAAAGGMGAGAPSVAHLNAAIAAATPKSDISQLSRGTADNPDESSWDCITRLASEVNWFAFSNGKTLYYMDGPDLVAQKPAAYIKRLTTGGLDWQITDAGTGEKHLGAMVAPTPNYTFDNTAFVYRSTHKRKGKVIHRSRIAKPATPSELYLNIVCGIDFMHAGDVVVMQNAGPLNGRWIITDATRNCLADVHTQFTLAPPTAPNPEPQATQGDTGKTTTKTGSGSGASTADPAITDTGKLSGVVQAAQKALAERSKYVYSEGPNRGNNGTLFGPAPRTMDCSAFATLCYKAAGLPDPNHEGYSPIGFTGSFITHCTKVGDPVAGDVCFYGPSESATKHMTIYIGNGQCISMGQQGDPVQLAAQYRGDFLGYYRSDIA